GRLDMTEFDERMTAAYEARTVPELAPLLADLPEHTPRDAVVPGGRPPPSPSRGRVGGVLSSTNRRGLWQVPQHLDVSLFLASSTLDFSTAAFTDQTRIELGVVLSSVDIIVPPGVRVDTDGITNILSSVTDRAQASSPPSATLCVAGYLTLSSVTIKTPNALTKWWRSVTAG